MLVCTISLLYYFRKGPMPLALNLSYNYIRYDYRNDMVCPAVKLSYNNNYGQCLMSGGTN